MKLFLLRSLIAAGSIIFCAVLISTIRTTPLIDDSVNAVVSKNIANGVGYCTSFYEIKCFDPRITTGPTLLLPAALAIKTLGNESWVPGLVNFLLTTGLLAWLTALFIGRSPYLGERSKTLSLSQLFSALFFALFLLFLFVGNETHNSGEYIAGRGFSKLVGDFASILLFWIGVLFIHKDPGQLTKKDYFLSALILGLAVLTKFIILMPCTFFFIFFFLWPKPKLSHLRSAIVPICAGISLPLISFELLKLASLGVSGYFHLKREEMTYFADAGSGVRSAAVLHEHKVNLIRNFPLLVHHFGTSILGAVIVFLFACLLRIQFKKHDSRWIFALLFAGLMSTLWWLLLSPSGLVRHLFPGVLSLALVFFLLSLYNFKYLKFYQRGLLGIFFVIYLSSQVPLLRSLSHDIFKNKRLDGYRKTLTFLNSLNGSRLYGCGFWFNADLEYGLKGTNNFSDCLANKFPPENLGATAYAVKSDFWNWGQDPKYNERTEPCYRHSVFQTGPFQVGQCN